MNFNKQSKRIEIVIATGNLGKLREFREFFSDLRINMICQPKGFEVFETGQSFAENARIKALAASKKTGLISLADDSGLKVDALNGAPGVYSARYAETDKKRIKRLLSELNLAQNRKASFVSALCLASRDKVLAEVEGNCYGRVTLSPRGKEGFGYDPIFEVIDNGLTFSEMGLEKKKLMGHRGKACMLLKPILENLILDELSQ